MRVKFVIRRTDKDGPVGSCDQMESIWTQGRRVGLITGAGAKFKIEGLKMEGKKVEIIKQLEENEILLEPLYHEILCRFREKYGKSRDNWRVGEFLTVEWPKWDRSENADINSEDE